MIGADAYRITNGDNTYFTRLSALGGFGRPHERTERAFGNLEQLIGKLTEKDFLVVDCSFFQPLPSQAHSTFIGLFSRSSQRPTILLRQCDEGFNSIYEKIACDHSEPNLATLEEPRLIELAERKSNPPNRFDYLIIPVKSQRPPDTQIKVGLTLEDAYLLQVVSKAARCLTKDNNPLRLRSTPFRSSHYIDCCSILGNPIDYIWFISRLATDFLRLVSFVLNRQEISGLQATPRLLACTRNGAAIAGAIQAFLTYLFDDNLRLDVVDRFGPTQRMVEEYDGGDSQDNEGHRWYVYIGDIAIAGTEIKIAEAHAHYRGIPLMGGLVIGSVLTFLERDIIQFRPKDSVANRFSVFPLIHINELELDRTLKYEFP
jgi:hypothetical protein